MPHDRLHRPGDHAEQPGRGSAEGAAGKRSLTESLPVRSGGAALPGELRAPLESGLGADLSGVRLHDGPGSAQAADRLGARAFTTGNDVHFAAGELNPGTREGNRLIAHEVVHTVQQGGAPAAPSLKPSDASKTGDAVEVEADAIADAFVKGTTFGPPQQRGAGVHRQERGAGQDAAVQQAHDNAGTLLDEADTLMASAQETDPDYPTRLADARDRADRALNLAVASGDADAVLRGNRFTGLRWISPDRRDDLRAVYNRSRDPQVKARLSQLLFDATLAANQGHAGPRTGALLTSARAEHTQAMGHLLAQYRRALAAARNDAERARVDRRFVDLIADVDRARRRELRVELKHQVELTSEDTVSGWSESDLAAIDQAMEDIPRGDLQAVTSIRREDHHPQHADWDMMASGTDITVYDGAFTDGNFRATGEESVIGGHRRGGGRSEGPVGPVEEALGHEVGHTVHNRDPALLADFMRLGGWEELATGFDLILALTTEDPMMDAAHATSFRADLDAHRASLGGYAVRHGEWIYSPHASVATAYWRRHVNRMADSPQDFRQPHPEGGTQPGRTRTPELGAHGNAHRRHSNYAVSSPREHFAEMYTHMIHVPERVHMDYVDRPRRAVQLAQARVREAESRVRLERSTGVPDLVREAQSMLVFARGELQQRQDEQAALTGQWTLMRERVFGVTPQVVEQRGQQLDAVAAGAPAGDRQAWAQDQAREFRARAERAATPEQLDRLFNEHQRRIQTIITTGTPWGRR